MPTLQHTAGGSSRGDSSYHRLSRTVYAGNADAMLMTKGEVAADGSQHGPCGSSDRSCSTAGGMKIVFAGAAAAAATAARPSGSGCGRPYTPCSPFLPPPLGIAGTAAEPLPHGDGTALQGGNTAGAPLPLPPTLPAAAAGAGGELTGSRKSRKRKDAALSRRQRRAAQRVTIAAGQLRLKR